MKLKLELSYPERATIVAALVAYDFPGLAHELSARAQDTADDGPEVAILSVDRP